jgi:hypothetical protein
MMKSIALAVLLLGLLNPGAEFSVEGNTIYMDRENEKQMIIVHEEAGQKVSTEIIQLHQLYGKWKDETKNDRLEFKTDGNLVRNGVNGTYRVLDSKTVQIVIQGTEERIPYQLDKDTLKWGTNLSQTFVKE